MIRFNVGIDAKQIEQLAQQLKSRSNPIENDELITIITKRGYEILQQNNSEVSYKYSSRTGLTGDLGYEIISNTVSKLFNHDKIAPFQEFGTGVMGKENPLPSSILEEADWIYDEKNHGNNGWWYPVENEPPDNIPKQYNAEKNQWYAWTKGQVGHNVFGSTMDQLKQEIPTIISNYLKNKK